MTDSRVEAVRAALLWARDRGLDPHDKQMAQAAIEANDAWLLPDDVSEHTRKEYFETIAGIERVRSALKERNDENPLG